MKIHGGGAMNIAYLHGGGVGLLLLCKISTLCMKLAEMEAKVVTLVSVLAATVVLSYTQDEDYCKSAPCAQKCENSYRCSCKPGYILDSDGWSCDGINLTLRY